MKVFFVAGENSGDMHGANLIRHIKAQRPDWVLAGLGGPQMEEAGMRLIRNMVNDLAIVGFSEVFLKLPVIWQVKNLFKRELIKEKPDAVVCIDYPGFNLMLVAPMCKELGIKLIYYIVPQFWAWHRSRIEKFKKYCDKIYPIFPFEAKMLQQEGVDAEYLGHPLLDVMKLTMTRDEVFERFDFDPDKKLIGILPGSRKREVRTLMPIMLEAAQRLLETRTDIQFVLPRSKTISLDLVDTYLSEYDVPVKIVDQYRFNVRAALDFAWVKSGTSTLEGALLGVPFVIIYKVKYLTGWIAKILISTPFIGLPNIVAGDLVVPELLQDQATGQNLAEQTQHYLRDKTAYENMQYQLQKIRNMFGPPGSSKRTADSIVEYLESEE
ncbi:MAG: lipid-A-disaccharide synthase [Candidatus Sumerlaeia bacterium]